MPNLNARRFSDPETLSRIRPDSLLAWLRPVRDYFERRGVALPAELNGAALDYQRLAAVFVDPTPDMPKGLVESLYLVHGMANADGMDAILDAAAERGLALNVGDDPEPADVALQTWLQNPALLEELHNQHQLTRPRSFLYFVTDKDPVPAFSVPSAAQLRALEARLDGWYAKHKRGRGCRVLAYPKDGECWFLVRHGLPCKREAALEDGQPASVFYRPQRHDVLVYDASRGDIRVNCCGKRELEEFRKAFGVHLFGDETFFPGTAKYTLAPLVRDGRNCLACRDVPGIERVELKEVEVFYPGKHWQCVTRKSNDIFSLVEKGWVRWPESPGEITRATFEVKFSDAKMTRRVTLVPANKALYGRDDDSALVEKWLAARGFILQDTDHEDTAGLVE